MRKHFKRYLPDPEKLRKQRVFALLGNTLLHPALWHLNRRSAAGAVAVGLFCGLIPGPFQVLGSAILCLVFHANLPLAIVVTFYTNPLTIVPLYLVAFQLGKWALGNDSVFIAPPAFDWHALSTSMSHYVEWAIGLGKPLALGLPILATALAITGYALVALAWRWHLVNEIRRRTAHRSTVEKGRPR